MSLQVAAIILYPAMHHGGVKSGQYSVWPSNSRRGDASPCRDAAERLRRSPLSVSMTLLSVKLLHIIKTITSTPVAEIELTPMTS